MQLRGHCEGQRVCLCHMRVRLPGSFVGAKSTVLFTAPPASAWQLCLPVLYLIPPAKLALTEISLPDPLGLQAEACVPTSVAQAWSP